MSTEQPTNPPLTKSQKKRLKQKRAKERKAAQAASDPSSSSNNASSLVEPLDPLNAHDAMKIGLQQLGFDLVDINTSIEQMWNLDLDYSDINAVVAFMTSNANDNGKSNGETDGQQNSESANGNGVNGVTGVTTKMNAMEEAEMALKNADAILGSATTTIVNDNGDHPQAASPASVAEKTLTAEEESKTVSTSSITASATVATTGKDTTTVPQTVANGTTSTSGASATGAQATQQKSITATQETASSVIPSTTNDGYMNGGVGGGTTKEVVENKSQPVAAAAATPATKAPPSLKTKLDIVANNENLMDAIVALTEWIVKAATPVEVRHTRILFCNSTNIFQTRSKGSPSIFGSHSFPFGIQNVIR